MSNPICKSCNSPLSLKIMKIIEGDCWKCNASMKIAVMHSPHDQIRGSTHPGPDLFNTEEVDFARSKEVIIKSHHSHTAEETYQANTCGSCDAFVGSHFLFEYSCQADEKTLENTDFEIGYHCENCYLEDEMKAYKESFGDA